MKKELTQTYVQELFDYAEGKLLWKKKRKMNRALGTVAGSRHKRYLRVCIDQKLHMAHRIVWLWHYGFMPTQIDHINGDRFDNRIENLREATQNENQYNTCKPRNNTSGVKNVSWDRVKEKWRVELNKDNKRVFCKMFDDLELAELVAIEVREKFHKEFARHV